MEAETEYVDMGDSVPMRKLTLKEIKSATEVDSELQALVHLHTRLAERRAEVPSQSHAYFPFREELSIQDGVVRIVAPYSLRQCMIDKVHPSHLGI